jgi:hypothetical protein
MSRVVVDDDDGKDGENRERSNKMRLDVLKKRLQLPLHFSRGERTQSGVDYDENRMCE